MSLGEWLNSVILQQAAEEGVQGPLAQEDEDAYGEEIATVHQRLDDITRRIEQFTRGGPAAYAPKRSRNDDSQITDLINRLDRRIDQFANIARTMPGVQAPPMAPNVQPNVQLPPSLDRAVAEIAARQRALNGQPAQTRQPQHQQTAVAAPRPAEPPAPVLMPVPTQDLSGLEDQLRRITDQIETLRKPGVEEAINALRGELGEIGRALNDAMPRRAIDTIEKQIAGLTQRIAEGRQAGVDGGALSGVEHGLAEVRDALRGLTPAENLVGFNEAVAGLAHKIDLIVAERDPASLQQLEHAITTLRDMAAHVASNETVSGLAGQVQMLGEKVEHLAMGGAGDALNHLEQRIEALSNALAERAQNGSSVPPRLEALVESLSDKIEQIQQSRGDNVGVGHLEDHIVRLVQRLDASDSRLGHLEAIERGLADVLIQIDELRSNKQGGGLRAEGSPGVDALKFDIARTQDALDAVNGTLGIVVDRLATIEKDIRGGGRGRGPADESAELTQPVGRVAARVVSDEPPRMPQATPLQMPAPEPRPTPQPAQIAPPPPAPVTAPAPKRMAAHAPINPDLPPDQPLEPGSGPPRLHPGARIAASEAALGGARPAPASGGKSGFIAAARRAAQAALETSDPKPPSAEPLDLTEADISADPSLRAKVMKRVKSLFVAASIIAVVVGIAQIAGPYFLSGPQNAMKTAQAPDTSPEPDVSTVQSAAPTGAANPLAPPQPSGSIAAVPPLGLGGSPQTQPSLLSPPVLSAPMLGSNDVTGSISRAGNARNVRPAVTPPPTTDKLPIAIGGTKLRNAATSGDGAAAYEVAVRFAEGRGVPANAEEAARWYERAASKGVAPAQFRYASMLEKGQGVKKDLGQARRLYLAAAARGNAKAMHNLAVLYAEGIDGKPDYATAAQWFGKASRHGIADSQYNLGVLAARGLGIEKNLAESYLWFSLAAAQGDKEAARKRDEVASQLDAQALAQAQNAVKTFAAAPQPQDAITVAEPPGGWDNAPHAPPQARPKAAGPLSLGAFNVGKR